MRQRLVTVPQGTFESGEIFATIIRCGCGDPDSHSKLGLTCPTPRAVELAGEGGLVASVTADEIREFSYERDPTLGELFGDLFRAGWTWLKSLNPVGAKANHDN
jgi:hypothetical protein